MKKDNEMIINIIFKKCLYVFFIFVLEISLLMNNNIKPGIMPIIDTMNKFNIISDKFVVPHILYLKAILFIKITKNQLFIIIIIKSLIIQIP